MIYYGHVKNGVVVLDDDVVLPDGTTLRVEVDRADSGLWQNKTVEDLARGQGVPESDNDLGGFAIDWPEEDSVDEFLAFLREVRR